MNKTRIKSAGCIEEMPRAAWDGVVEEAQGPVFYRWEWLRAWERATVEDMQDRRYLLVEAPDEEGGWSAVAAMPLYCLRSSPFWDGGYEIDAGVGRQFEPSWVVGPSLYAFSGGIPVGDGVEDGLRREAVEAVVENGLRFAGDRGSEVLALANLAEGDPLLDEWRRSGEAATVYLDCNHVLTLPATFDAYLVGLPGKVRTELRRRCRRADEAGLEIVDVPSASRDDVARFHALTVESTDKHGIRPLYDVPTLTALADQPSARFALGYHRGELVGGFLAFEDETTLYVWCGAVDYGRLSDLSTYVVLMAHLVRDAIARGLRRVEFGRGNYQFKERHGFDPVPLTSVFLPTSHARPGLVERLCDMHARMVRFVRDQGGEVPAEAAGEPG
jgi:predicted N-acyltransferase